MRLGAAIIIAILFAVGLSARAESVRSYPQNQSPTEGTTAKHAPTRQGNQVTDKVLPVPVPKVETVPLGPPPNPEANQRGTEQMPPIVQVLPTPKSEPEAANKATNHMSFSDEIAIIVVEVSLVQLVILVAVLIVVIRSSRRRVRAYVWCRATELHDLQVGKLPYVKLEVRNAGQTPAYDLQIGAECFVFENPLPPKMPFPPMYSITPTKMILHPGAEPPFECVAKFGRTDLAGLDPIQVNQLIKGDKIRLFVFVIMTYRDAFRKRRETQMCVSVEVSGAVSGNPKYEFTFRHADQHNLAT